MTFDYELAIVGGGSAGYSAAHTAGAEGFCTVAIEGGTKVGALLILRGGMPTKFHLGLAATLLTPPS